MESTNASAIYLHALTPVHAGTGQASASAIDLPIARERATNWPIIPATSLKGVLRNTVKDELTEANLNELFGWVGPNDTGAAGKLQIGDARLLCFPVRSWKGVFAYATCPLSLTRLHRDFTALGIDPPFAGDVPNPPADDAAITAPKSVLAENKLIWIDDLELMEHVSDAAGAISQSIASAVFTDEKEWQAFTERFVILHNDVFDFLAEYSTEVTARIALNPESKTVDKDKGALWYEEAVPAEAIFVAPILGAALPKLPQAYVQIGGNETVGRGFCRVVVRGRPT
jgi:CRISPR-associated protein Cmr4